VSRQQYYGGLADASCGMGCEYRWQNFSPTDENVYDGQESDDFEVVSADCNVHAAKWDSELGKRVPIGKYKITYLAYWNEGLQNWVHVDFTLQNIADYGDRAEYDKEFYVELYNAQKEMS